MHLEDVYIGGFKSFSQNTEMSFQPGIGVIIGNNGVGKSNILDAVVWALGEDDIQRVRCYQDQELFFSGSKASAPADTIRVELNFKGAGQNKDRGIRVARELNRRGENCYLIDDQRFSRDAYGTKLKEINLSQALKTIIRQEEINDILMMSPGDRFAAIQSLMEIESAGELKRRLSEVIDPLFQRYMSYLMPLGGVKMGFPLLNGKKGFDIDVALPGNRLRRVHQLSGGERSVTSLALKLALFQELESPFFLLDEVEPSLDYTNHKSMQAFLKDVASDKQLIMITHLRSTIELADTLHGVRTRFDGSSFMKFYFVMNDRLLRLYKCC